MSLFRVRYPVVLAGLCLCAATHAQQPPLPAGVPPERPAAPSATPAAGPSRSTETTVGPIKFGDITVDAALEMLERWSGRSILRPAGLPATSLSFSLNQKVTREEAREALETLLTMNGIAVTPLGDKFLKVTPLNTARTEAPQLIEGSTFDLPPSGRLASKVFSLKFLRVGEFMPQVASILNPGTASPPLLFDKGNAALITDTISNLQRIELLLIQLDQPALGGLTPKFYKVQNTTASELVARLQSILGGAGSTQIGTGTTYQADDRTNQIILLSDPRQFPLFDDLIAKLDTVGESSTRQEVIPLKHANATEIATVLGNLVSGQNNAARAANQMAQNQTNVRNATNAALARAATNQPQNANPQPNQQPNPTQAAALAAAQARLNQIVGAPGAESAPQQFSNILTIAADERSNALIVSGTVDDLRLIKDLIAQLDVLLAQVRIEVVIAEITLSDEAASGIDSLGFVVKADKLVGFSGAAPGFVAKDGTFVDETTGIRSLSATLALTTTPRKSNTNILSVPNIVTTHNKEAILFVGEKRPVISSYLNSGTNTGTNIGTGYSTSVTQQEIGITLKVTPLIGHDGSVQMEISQKVDDILGEVLLDGNSQPIVGSRTTDSFVSAKSGEIIVLGGLQRKSQNKATSRLAGIPIIGDLLGKRSRENTRTDLVFFLRPYVLTNTPADNTEALERLKHSPQHKDVESALKGALPVKP